MNHKLIDICPSCKTKLVVIDDLCNFCFEEKKTMQLINEEFKKCKESPYYFATKYLTVNNKPFTTNLTEKEFNELASANKNKIVKIRKGIKIVKN